MRRKCIICETRPVQTGQAAGYCKQCADQIAARSVRAPKVEVEKYITYRGKIAAVIFDHEEQGVKKYKVTQVYKSIDQLPKGKIINLDTYCEGFDRNQIKTFKRLMAAAS
jgi:hypothetical protein